MEADTWDGGAAGPPARAKQGRYLVDNTLLCSATDGLAYRRTKHVEDKTGIDVPWGTLISGIEEEDAWLRVGHLFLPMVLNDKQVVFRNEEPAWEQAAAGQREEQEEDDDSDDGEDPPPLLTEEINAEEDSSESKVAIAVYTDSDAFPYQDAYVHLLDCERDIDTLVALGARWCYYFGYGGFCIRPEALYYREQVPEELERGRVHAPGDVLVVVRRTPRPKPEATIVPMGHYCLTAFFLKQIGRREKAFPLDWSRHTLKVWLHMLQDNCETLLRQRATESAEEEHPYNSMFEDVHMFLHQGGFATDKVLRYTERLRLLMAEQRAFGFALYFEGAENCQSSFEDLLEDAVQLALSAAGFCHVTFVYFLRESSNPPKAEWAHLEDRLSVLRYMPLQVTNYWDGSLHPQDTVCLAELLEARFPTVFTHGGSEGRWRLLDTRSKSGDERTTPAMQRRGREGAAFQECYDNAVAGGAANGEDVN